MTPCNSRILLVLINSVEFILHSFSPRESPTKIMSMVLLMPLFFKVVKTYTFGHSGGTIETLKLGSIQKQALTECKSF